MDEKELAIRAGLHAIEVIIARNKGEDSDFVIIGRDGKETGRISYYDACDILESMAESEKV